MDSFSISQLEQFSGIKAHTIRIWEQRYNALKPSRSEGNTRYYDNSQLRRLLNIVSLMGSGYKVSTLCSMSDDQLFLLLAAEQDSVASKEDPNEYFVSQLIAAATSFDEAHFEKIFSNCLLRMGMRNTYVNVIYPLLKRMGLMWTTNTISPAYEHFSSNLICQKLHAAIDGLPPAKSSSKSWVLFLPENEIHEIGLIFAHYLLREAGHTVFNLGSNLPFETLQSAINQLAPKNILFFFVHNDSPDRLQEYLDLIEKNFSKTKIHVSGNEKLMSQLNAGKEVNKIITIQEFERIIA